MITRRALLGRLGVGVAVAGLPGLTLAAGPSDARFVLVILRGAADGLAIAPPYAEPAYPGLRGPLALAGPGQADGVSKLDGLFGLHPAFTGVFAMYRDGEAAVIHALASPYRSRSHFDGQDVLENGAAGAGLARDGWLNRAIGPLRGVPGDEIAIALAQNTPLVLRGDNSVTSWAPSQLPDTSEDTLRRIRALYAGDEFLAERLEQALESRAIAGTLDDMDGTRRGNEIRQWQTTAEAAARFLTATAGPRIAVLETGGWDTHANQGAANGYLANRFAALDDALQALKTGLGDAWADTVVAVATEFGRTVAVNGTGGTDHGTATAALLLGGAVNGGRVIADWPGLGAASLYERRDLYPTTDIRGVWKSILAAHLGLAEGFVEATVFPGSRRVAPLEGLLATGA